MRATTSCALTASWMLAVSTLAAEATPRPCPTPEIHVESHAGGESVMVPLPGRLLGYAAPRVGPSGRALLLLVGPVHPDEGETRPNLSLLQTVNRLREQGVFDDIDADDIRVVIESIEGEVLESTNVVMGSKAEREARTSRDCPMVETVVLPTLFELRSSSSPSLLLVRDDLPAGARALLAVDIDGDGKSEILVETDGALFVVPVGDVAAGGALLRPLFTDPDLAVRGEEPRGVRFPPEPVAIRSPFDDSSEVPPRRHRKGARYVSHGWADQPLHIRVTGLGELRLYTPGSAEEDWALSARIPLPVRTSPDPLRLLLTSPQVRTVGRTAAGTLFLAAGPVPYGTGRLKTVVIEIGDGEPRVRDAWSRVSDGDQVERSGYLLMDDQPYLWVTTENDDSAHMFGGEPDHFHLFRLSSDRTRAGGEPVLEIKANKLPLSDGLKASADVNGDGRDDLVLAGQRNTPLLAVFLQQENGRFSRSAKKQAFSQTGRPIALHDLDGDDVLDLLVEDGETFRIHTGVTSRDGRTIMTPEPRWTAPRLLRGKSTPPHRVVCGESALLDLDGDGRQEIVCAGRDGHGRDAIKIVRFTRQSD